MLESKDRPHRALGWRTVIDKIIAIIFPIAAFVAAGFEHSIANISLIPLGLLLAGNAQALQSVGLGAEQLSRLNIPWFWHNLAAASRGNIVGGGLLVGLVYWFIYLQDKCGPTHSN